MRVPVSPPRPRVRRTGALALALAAAASGAALGCSPKSPPRADPRWVPVVSNAALAVRADTSRIVRDTAGTRVWLRFDYTAANPAFADVPLPWRRMEEEERVDCAGRRAQDLAMVVYDTSGAGHDGSGALAHEWQTFQAHPLTVMLFEPLCAVLAGVRPRPIT